MKAVILAGGLGSRISEESNLRPKPMIQIGGKPILWHIMKIYSHFGINDFIICTGYKGYVIKEYFSNYFLHMSDVTFCMRENKMEIHHVYSEPWNVTLVDTGEITMTGGRLKRVMPFIGNETFCLTYGDGVSDVDISSVIAHHKSAGKLATVTAIRPPGRFGSLEINNSIVTNFQEKPAGDGIWINGGFFILEPEVFNYIEGDDTVWEQQPLQKLTKNEELTAYKHNGFWQAMDTLRDKNLLEDAWASGDAPWKIWVTMFANQYANRRVLVTGHTGFKGSWLTLWLRSLDAHISGIALPPETDPSHWDLLSLDINSMMIDIRDFDSVQQAVTNAQPEIVFHLAAQPLVRRSYSTPLETWSTNLMGTANILEACRQQASVKAIVLITTDKCYENQEWVWGYRETDRLGGHDPYSASKAGTELVASSYRNSFFKSSHSPLLATARAGNVIGGGDWSEDRLIPDLVRATKADKPLEIRSATSTRPWQHVLECLSGYLALGQKLLEGEIEFASSWNFGPDRKSNRQVQEMLEQIQQNWHGIKWFTGQKSELHEARLLHLDSSKARDMLAWQSVWGFEETVAATSEWYKAFLDKREVISSIQLDQYIALARAHKLAWTETGK